MTRRAAALAAAATVHNNDGGQFHPRKLFVGGLALKTTTAHLREHFQHFGSVIDTVVLRWPDGRSRGFGYVTFAQATGAEAAMKEFVHEVSGRKVDVKRAVPGTNKVFVGGLPQSAVAADLADHFGKFGIVSDTVVMMDPATGRSGIGGECCVGDIEMNTIRQDYLFVVACRSRGFGFVCFLPGPEGAEAVEKVMVAYAHHKIRGKWIEVKSAAPPHKVTPSTSSGPSSEAGTVTPPLLAVHDDDRSISVEAAGSAQLPPPARLHQPQRQGRGAGGPMSMRVEKEPSLSPPLTPLGSPRKVALPSRILVDIGADDLEVPVRPESAAADRGTRKMPEAGRDFGDVLSAALLASAVGLPPVAAGAPPGLSTTHTSQASLAAAAALRLSALERAWAFHAAAAAAAGWQWAAAGGDLGAYASGAPWAPGPDASTW